MLKECQGSSLRLFAFLGKYLKAPIALWRIPKSTLICLSLSKQPSQKAETSGEDDNTFCTCLTKKYSVFWRQLEKTKFHLLTNSKKLVII